MKKYQLLTLILIVFVVSCKNKVITTKRVSYIDMKWIDSIVKNSDSSYTKNYYRKDIATAAYYISKRDSAMLEIMRDSSQNIKRFLLTHNQIMKRTAEFYDNGQLMVDVLFDDNGNAEGKTVTYYNNGKVKSKGIYKGGIKVGKWLEFLEDGKEILTNYDTTGIIIKTN